MNHNDSIYTRKYRIKFDIFDSPVYNDKKFYRTTSNIIMAFFKILTKKSKYENILFLGLKSEYDDLKIEVPNLEFYDCKDFLEAAQIIKSSNFFIGNSSFGFTIAEGLKVPRIMESYPDFPVIYPNGNHGYDFYFQVHFEELCKKLYKLKT